MTSTQSSADSSGVSSARVLAGIGFVGVVVLAGVAYGFVSAPSVGPAASNETDGPTQTEGSEKPQARAADPQPHALWSVHYHGTITMRVGSHRVDFSREQYQLQADAFHFEHGEGKRWHVHAKGVTLQYALETLGITVTNRSVSYRGRTYRGREPGTTVRIAVDGKPVTPSEYVLQPRDRVRIIVRTSA